MSWPSWLLFRHLEATEWIGGDFKVIEDAARSVAGVPCAGTPLAAASSATVHSSCSCVAHMFRVAEGVIDECLHANGAHGVEEVSASRGASF